MDTLNVKAKLLMLTAAGLTEAKIATDTGITQPTINRIKNGQEPREKNVRKLDAYFDCIWPSISGSTGKKP